MNSAVLALSTMAGWIMILALVIPTVVIFLVIVLRAIVQSSVKWADEARQRNDVR